MLSFNFLKDAGVSGKKVFLRADLDVPLANGGIEDDTRLLSAIPTLEYLLSQGAKIILAGHLGRPEGINKSLSLEPIAKWFAKQLTINNLQLTKIGEFEGWEIGPNIFLLENLRFFAGEEKNDPGFAKQLANLADIYVNEAFAVSHRAHASIVGIPKFLPHAAGFRLVQEIEHLNRVIQNPQRPLVFLISGIKEDKE